MPRPFRRLLALALLLMPAAPALAGGYVLDRATGVLTVTGTPNDGSSPYGFGNYNSFQAYELMDGTQHVDYWDQAGGMSEDFPPGTIKSIDCSLAASGLYSMNTAVDYLHDVPIVADISSSQFGIPFAPYSPATFFIGGYETFGYIRHDAVIVGYSELEYFWYSD